LFKEGEIPCNKAIILKTFFTIKTKIDGFSTF